MLVVYDMDATSIKKLLEAVAAGSIAPDAAMATLRALPFSDLGFAKHDGHRPLRNGFAEVILCEGKRREHVLMIVREALARGQNVFGTRADEALMAEIRRGFPEADCDPVSRTFRLVRHPVEPISATLAIVAAGTADVPVAEEAWRTAQFGGIEASRTYDVGVAGLHRLLASLEAIRDADGVIVVAGMEGALPSVVGGLVSAPIVAVPSRVG